jgi:nitrous oxidase accessory protein
MKKIVYILSFFSIFLYSNELQDAIDNAPSGSKITLAEGVYKGNIVINKPLIIDGVNKKARVVGDGDSSVITIKSSNVVIKNLTIENSGFSVEKVDSANPNK